MTSGAAEIETGKRGGGVLELFGPLLRAVLWGLSGFVLGAALTAVAQGDSGLTQEGVVIGYVAGLAGWLLGIGAWEAAVRPFFGGRAGWDEGVRAARYLRLNTDHKVIGIQYLVTATAAFFAAGLLAMLVRAELATADLDVFATNQQYNSTMGVHGTLMVFAVAVVAIVGGFGNYFVPLLIGAEDMVFPRLNALSYWFVPAGVAAIAASPALGGLQAGWTAYQPLGATEASGQLLYYLGVLTLGTSSLLTAINVVATTVYLRAPGLAWKRLPIFVWSMLVTSILNLLWVPVVAVAMIMAVLDRLGATVFFGAGGMPVLWQDLFWIFGHPEVYIIMLPAFGIWLEILPVMARKTLFGYRWAVASFLIVAFMSGIVWVHHMFVTVDDERLIPFMTTTELISIPTGFMFIAALGTLWRGRLRLSTPMLLVALSMLGFLVGGLTGVFLADVPADLFLQDTYFVVAHFHYVIVGGMVFAWLAGLYYWFPKLTGRMYDERWAKVGAWLTFAGFNLTFFPMFLLGVDGMNRRVGSYLPYLQGTNLFASVAGFVLGISFLVHLATLARAWASGPAAEANPWGGKTLEWRTSSPPPHRNFETEPVVVGDFYGYGEAGPEPELLPVPGLAPRLREPVPSPGAGE